MIFNPNSYRGFYAPFRVPFAVSSSPDKKPGDAPLVALCFNEFWYPYVQGALKALAREETYKGEKSCVQEWVQAGMDLCLTSPGVCGTVARPDWEPVREDDEWVQYFSFDMGQDEDNVFWVYSAFFRTVHLSFATFPVGLPVGVALKRCHVSTPSYSPNLTATFEDCLGNQTDLTPESGDEYDLVAMLAPFETWAKITISSDVWSYITMRWEGNWVCPYAP